MDMVIDPVAGHLYWVEYPDGRIQRSELNGTNVTTVVSLKYISTLDIDIQNRLVLFLNRRIFVYLLLKIWYSSNPHKIICFPVNLFQFTVFLKSFNVLFWYKKAGSILFIRYERQRKWSRYIQKENILFGMSYYSNPVYYN